MTIFFVSDTHFFHENSLKFSDEHGALMRPGFDDVDHMNEVFVQRWNSVVSPEDKVYHLGDVSWRYGPLLDSLMSRLNGKKRLLIGNHDKIKGTNLVNHFQKVELWRPFGTEGFICSHVPIHRGSFRGDGVVLNVHGHVHRRTLSDPDYMNVSVEVIDYTPVPMDVVLERVKERRS